MKRVLYPNTLSCPIIIGLMGLAGFLLPASAGAAVVTGPSGGGLITGAQLPSDQVIPELNPSGYNYSWLKFQYRLGSDQPIEEWITSAQKHDPPYKVLVSVAKNDAKIPPLGSASTTGQFCPWDSELRYYQDGWDTVYDPTDGVWVKEPHMVKEKSPGGNGYMDFRDQMRSLGKRLAKYNVDAYEIWNEPNTKIEWNEQGLGNIDPNNYAHFFACGVKGLKQGLADGSATNRDPTIISAALAPLSSDYDDLSFLSQFLDATGTLASSYADTGGTHSNNADKAVDYAGVIGWHGNVVKNLPPSDPSPEGFQRVKLGLKLLSDKKITKPIWMTEFGWGRDDARITLKTQSEYIAQSYGVAEQIGGIEAMFVFNFGFGLGEFYQWDISGIINPDCASTVEDYSNPDNLDTNYIYAPGSDEHDKVVYLEDKVLLPPSVLDSATEAALLSATTGPKMINTVVSENFAVNALSQLITSVKQKLCGLIKGFCTLPTSLGADQTIQKKQVNGQYNAYYVDRTKVLSSTYLPSGASIIAEPGYHDPNIPLLDDKTSPGDKQITKTTGRLGTQGGFYRVDTIPPSDIDQQITEQGKQQNLSLGRKLFGCDKREPDADLSKEYFFKANFPAGVEPTFSNFQIPGSNSSTTAP